MVEVESPEGRQKSRLIVILGPTASGKTSRAVSLCREINGEIISADSRQVYRGMDIGTGKDLGEYGDIAYHLIDICDAGEKYNLYRYIYDFQNASKEIMNRGKHVVVCGGTGMYLENAISGIRLPEVPENRELRKKLEPFSLAELTKILREYKTLHNTTDVDSCKRAIRAIEIEEYYRNHQEEAISATRDKVAALDHIIIGVDIPRDIRREKISIRLRDRLETGMVDEIKGLINKGIKPEDLIYYGLEYKYVTLYVVGEIYYEEMVSKLETAIHQFAKRQMTWFRGMERRGFKINWLPYDMDDADFNSCVMNLYHKAGDK